MNWNKRLDSVCAALNAAGLEGRYPTSSRDAILSYMDAMELDTPPPSMIADVKRHVEKTEAAENDTALQKRLAAEKLEKRRFLESKFTALRDY